MKQNCEGFEKLTGFRGITFFRFVPFNRGRTWYDLSMHIRACAELVQRLSFLSLSWRENAVGLKTKPFVLRSETLSAGTSCSRVMFPNMTSSVSTAAPSVSFTHLTLKALACRWSKPCNAAYR